MGALLCRLPAAPEAGRGAGSPRRPAARGGSRVWAEASTARGALQPSPLGAGGPGPARGELRPPTFWCVFLSAVLGVPVRPRPSAGGASPPFQPQPVPGEEFPQTFFERFNSSRLFSRRPSARPVARLELGSGAGRCRAAVGAPPNPHSSFVFPQGQCVRGAVLSRLEQGHGLPEVHKT